MWPNLQETADSVTFTEEILSGKLHFLCGAIFETAVDNETKIHWLHQIYLNPLMHKS